MDAPAPGHRTSARAGPRAAGRDPLLLGRLAVERGMLTEEKLAECVRSQKEMGGAASLGTLLVQRKLVTPAQLQELLALQKRRVHQTQSVPPPPSADAALEAYLMDKGWVTRERIAECVAEQERLARDGQVFTLGQLLVRRRLLQVDQLLEAGAACAASPSGVQTPTPASPPPTGDLGAYDLLEEIGRGGMGIIYRARQKVLNRIVALKILREGHRATTEAVRRFRREAESAGRLRHPHIVGVHEMGEHKGTPYYTMDFIEGVALDEAIKQGNWTLAAKAALLEKVARAVHFAHTRGIVHRDLKPANILVDTRGEPHITDFGLARLDDGGPMLTREGATVGTPQYMSPEQVRGQADRIDARSDIYALGVLLYRVLTGYLPFSGRNSVALYRSIVEDDPLPMKSPASPYAPDLEAIVYRCLQKEPEGRYPTALAMAEDLRNAMSDRPISARPLGPWERLRKQARRNRRPLAAAGGGALALTACIVWATLAMRQTEAERRRLRGERERSAREREEAETLAQRRSLDASRRQEYDRILAEAEALMEAGDAEQALRALDRATAAWPGGSEAYERRAAIHAIRMRSPQEAVREITAAIEHNPDDPNLYVARAGYLLDLPQPDASLAEKNLDEALRRLPEGMARVPALLRRSACRFMRDDFPGSLQDLESVGAVAEESREMQIRREFVVAARDHGRDAAVHSLRGEVVRALEAGGDGTNAALDASQVLITYCPGDADGYRTLAHCLRETKQYPQALRAYDRAIAVEPNDWRNYYYRGVAYLEIGDAERVRVAEREIATLALPPDERNEATYARAHLLLHLGAFDDARALLEPLCARNPPGRVGVEARRLLDMARRRERGNTAAPGF